MIRNSAKAIIVHENKLLLIKMFNNNNHFYILPGGGQEKYEILSDTVKRECIEETGYYVTVNDIIFIRDYIGRNHEFAKTSMEFHQVEFMFECYLDTSKNKIVSTLTDKHQTGLEWVPLENLKDVNLIPKILREKIPAYFSGLKLPLYLGDVN
jgi:8-oxo-dGTP diphosphatase